MAAIDRPIGHSAGHSAEHPIGHPSGSGPAASSASPYYHTPSGPMPAVAASQSALAPQGSHYGAQDAGHSSAIMPRKSSKAGLIAAIVTMLAVAGGIAGFLVVSSGKNHSQAIADSTDQDAIAGNDIAGNDIAGNDIAGNDIAGNDTAGNDTADKGDTAGDTAGNDTADQGNTAGDDEGSTVDTTTVITPAKAIPVKVLVISEPRAMVVRDGKKLGQTPRNIDVIPGEPMTITLTRSRYQDQQVTLDGSTESLEVKLSKRRTSSAGSGKTGGKTGGNKAGNGEGDKNNDQKAGDLGLGLE
jgi:hypothetical protein